MAKSKLNELLDWIHEANPQTIDEIKSQIVTMMYGERKRTIVIPKMREVITFFVINGYSEEAAIKAFNYYEDGKWHDSKGNKVVNWKQKMRSVWFKDENKRKVIVRVEPRPQDYFDFKDYEKALNDYLNN